MSKTIIIVGYGPGNGSAVAEKFGREGFKVALLGRDAERLAAGVSSLKAKGIDAAAFASEAGDPESIRATIRNVRSNFGPIAVIHWNAYGGADAGDLLTADASTLRGIFDVAALGLISAVQEALPDLKSAGDGAILITNGGFGDLAPEMDQTSVALNSMGIALGNAAKNKLAGLLSQRLKNDGIYVGEVTIFGTVKGTPTGNGNAIDPSKVAQKFWDLYQSRGELRATVS